MADKTITVELTRKELLYTINGLNCLRDDMLDDALDCLEGNTVNFVKHCLWINQLLALIIRLSDLVGEEETEST